MTWKNLRLFSIEGSVLEPDSVMNKLEPVKFDGDEGVTHSEVWREYNELRIRYVFKLPKYVKVSHLKDGVLREERKKMETFDSVDFHIRASGVLEAYGPARLCNKAMNKLSVLGEISPVLFGQEEFKEVMGLSSDLRKIRIRGVDDENVSEVILVGGGLSHSKELKRHAPSGKIQELNGRIDLPDKTYKYTMRSKNIKFYVKEPDEAQKDIEAFIDSLLQ